MAEIKCTFLDDRGERLEHYGVKGMKWYKHIFSQVDSNLHRLAYDRKDAADFAARLRTEAKKDRVNRVVRQTVHHNRYPLVYSYTPVVKNAVHELTRMSKGYKKERKRNLMKKGWDKVTRLFGGKPVSGSGGGPF